MFYLSRRVRGCHNLFVLSVFKNNINHGLNRFTQILITNYAFMFKTSGRTEVLKQTQAKACGMQVIVYLRTVSFIKF